MVMNLAPHTGRTARAAAFLAADSPRQPRLKLRSWKRVDKGSLIGFACISLRFGEDWLDIDDLPVLMTAGKAWASFPAKPILNKEGYHAKLPGSLKGQYVNILRWQESGVSTRFSRAVIRLVRDADPLAFGELPLGEGTP
jgi:hypothetical protein